MGVDARAGARAGARIGGSRDNVVGGAAVVRMGSISRSWDNVVGGAAVVGMGGMGCGSSWSLDRL